MKTSLRLCLTAAALSMAAGTAMSGPDAAVAGQKLDSGLGDLPHYSKWADKSGRTVASNRVVGESLDDGLADLPHYSKWVDPTGRDPLGRLGTQIASAKR